MTSEPSNDDECANKADVEDDCNGSKECASSEAEDEEDSQDGIEGGGASQTLNSQPTRGDVDVSVGEDLTHY